MQTLQMPGMPDLARITLNSKTTALMMLDYVEHICAAQPKCRSQMLPQLDVQRLPPALRNEHDVIFAVPCGVA